MKKVAARFLVGLAITSLSLAGCQQTVRTEMSSFNTDDERFVACRQLFSDLKRDEERVLSSDEVTRLFEWQNDNSLLSGTATAALYNYADRDPALKERLVEHIPTLLESPYALVAEQGVKLAQWYGIKEHRSQFQAMLTDLKGKRDLLQEEQWLRETLENALSS